MTKRLTVVFEYPDEHEAIDAKEAFKKGKIPNLVGLELGDALEKIKNMQKVVSKKASKLQIQ